MIGIMGGSLTLVAEVIRGGLMCLIELFSLVVMRRIHRGQLADLEFGTGKLEQVANTVIGAAMLGGAIWVIASALAIVAGERALGTPFGLARVLSSQYLQRRRAQRIVSVVAARCPEPPPRPAPGWVEAPMCQSRPTAVA